MEAQRVEQGRKAAGKDLIMFNEMGAVANAMADESRQESLKGLVRTSTAVEAAKQESEAAA